MHQTNVNEGFPCSGLPLANKDKTSHMDIGYVHQTNVNEGFPCSGLPLANNMCKKQEVIMNEDMMHILTLRFLSVLALGVHLGKQMLENTRVLYCKDSKSFKSTKILKKY